jgi:hypothetical protein
MIVNEESRGSEKSISAFELLQSSRSSIEPDRLDEEKWKSKKLKK